MKLYPSLMCINFANVKEEIAALDQTTIAGYHIDIMDGHFVPNMTLGINDITAVASISEKPLDVHLMTADTDTIIEYFLPLDVERICIHYEATLHHDRVLGKIKDSGKLAGIAINPATPIALLTHILDVVDFVLVMTVNPGFAGQSFVPYCMKKIASLSQYRKENGLSFEIEVDGSVREHNLKELAQSGTDSVVLGSALFGAGKENYAAMVEKLSKVE